MAKQKKNRAVTQENKFFWGREIEYIMPRTMFDDMTKECKGDKYQYAIDQINQTYCVLGYVTSLVLEEAKINISPILELE